MRRLFRFGGSFSGKPAAGPYPGGRPSAATTLPAIPVVTAAPSGLRFSWIALVTASTKPCPPCRTASLRPAGVTAPSLDHSGGTALAYPSQWRGAAGARAISQWGIVQRGPSTSKVVPAVRPAQTEVDLLVGAIPEVGVPRAIPARMKAKSDGVIVPPKFRPEVCIGRCRDVMRSALPPLPTAGQPGSY